MVSEVFPYKWVEFLSFFFSILKKVDFLVFFRFFRFYDLFFIFFLDFFDFFFVLFFKNCIFASFKFFRFFHFFFKFFPNFFFDFFPFFPNFLVKKNLNQNHFKSNHSFFCLNRTRGMATGLTAALNYLLSFVATKTYYNLETSLSMPGVALFNCFIIAIGFVFMYFILPETEGKTLEDIELHFADKSKRLTDRQIRKMSKQLGTEKDYDHIEEIIKLHAKNGCVNGGYTSGSNWNRHMTTSNHVRFGSNQSQFKWCLNVVRWTIRPIEPMRKANSK